MSNGQLPFRVNYSQQNGDTTQNQTVCNTNMCLLPNGPVIPSRPIFPSALPSDFRPSATTIDTNYLKTLNDREIKSGYAEIIKHCIISNSFFDDLIDSSTIHYNEDIIYNSIQIKNKIVSLDKLENNIRKNLNFGHTIGHAIESLYLKKEDKLLHGEAISIGMICESFISCKKTNVLEGEMSFTNSAIEFKLASDFGNTFES